MPLVLPNVGLPFLTDRILRAAPVGMVPWQLVLWTNEYEPVQATVWSDLEEAVFDGYSRITLTPATWTAAVMVGDEAVSTYGTTPQLWTCTSDPEEIYGYAIIDSVSEKIYIVEAFEEPEELVVGRTIGVLPRYTQTTAP
jgi:hypothetical protein